MSNIFFPSTNAFCHKYDLILLKKSFKMIFSFYMP